jgi:hypothetical protein
VFGLATALLARAVANDLPFVETFLANAGRVIPQEATLGIQDPVLVALVGIGATATVTAIGAFLVGYRTGAGFALLVAVTLAWFTFPYADVPWATLLADQPADTFDAPASVWWIGTAMTGLATVEVCVNARQRLLDRLIGLGFAETSLATARNRTREGLYRWLGLTFGLGGLVVVTYAASRNLLERLVVVDPDLVLAPAVAGLVLGLALWVWARSE